MKKAYRIASLALTAIMLLALLPAAAEAAMHTVRPASDPVTISAGTVEHAIPGETVSVPIIIGGGDYSAHSLVMRVYYDPAYLTVKTVTPGALWSALPVSALKMYNYTANPGCMAIGIASPSEEFSGHGTLMTVNFTVSAGCTLDLPITVMINEMNYEPIDGDFAAVDVIAVNGAVHLYRCTVTFIDPIEDEIIDFFEVLYGQSVTAPAAPEHEGFTFVGWDVEFSCVTEDITVTAQYQQNGPQPLVGDANLDGTISFADVAALYNLILTGGGITAELQYVCDVNGDGSIGFADVAALYNYVFAGA